MSFLLSFIQMGCTPMHYACQQCFLPVVEYLLNTCKVNPVPKNKDDRIPMQMLTFSSMENTEDKTQIYGLFAPFIREAFPLDNFSKVFICGSSKVGKTSLNEVLKLRSKKIPGFSYKPEEEVSAITKYKFGINSSTVSSHEIGNVILYDFVSHTDNIYQSLQLHSPAVFVVIINMKKERDAVKRELYYWFEFVSVMTSKLTCSSRVIVVGSRADEISDGSRESIERSFFTFVKAIADESISKSQDFECFVAVDCHRPGDKGVSRLVKRLSQSCKSIMGQSDSISYQCLIFYVFLKGLEKIVISVKKLCSKIQANCRDLLPSNTSAVIKHLKTLHDKGMILFIENNDATGGWAVPNKEALLQEFIDMLLSPHSFGRLHGISSNTGVVPVSCLNQLFPLYHPEMIKKFLLTFELCHSINIEDLKQMSTNIAPYFDIRIGKPVFTVNIISCPGIGMENGEILFIPSLIDNDPPLNTMNAKPKFGWCLYCSNPQKFFSASFFRSLLLRLALNSPLIKERKEGKDGGEIKPAQRYDRQCKVWLNGIYWMNQNIEVLVELSENRYITLLMSDVNTPLSQNRCSSIIRRIVSLQRKLSPCATQECIITPDQLKSWKSTVPETRERVDVNKVAKAMMLQENTVPDINGEAEISLEDILSDYEPYLSIAPVFMKDLFDNEKNDEKLTEAHSRHLWSIFPDIVELLDKDNVTYQAAREQLNKFSIFLQNPLVSCNLQHN